MTNGDLYRILAAVHRGHVGHTIGIHRYSDQSISLECDDCRQVLMSADRPGEHYGRTDGGSLIGPYDTVEELNAELAAANRGE